MRLQLFTLGLVLCSSAAQAQTWDTLQTLPRDVTVRVFEMGGEGWAFADGMLLLGNDHELTILRSGRPLVIPKAAIARVEKRYRDLPVEGAVIGALIGIVAMSVIGGQGCSSSGARCVGTAMLS